MKQNQHTSVWKKLGIWAGVFVVAILAISTFASRAANTTSQTDMPSVSVDEIAESDHVKGNSLSTVSLIEYSDFQCPACAAYHPIVKQVLEEYGNRIRFAYRHFPLTSIHKNAVAAARAAESAAMQGKFYEYHDMLFEKQSDWSESGNADAMFISYAEALGLDRAKFEEDMKSDAAKNKVDADMRNAIRAGLPGTPSFFLNGKAIANPRSYDEFAQLIEDELSLAK